MVLKNNNKKSVPIAVGNGLNQLYIITLKKKGDVTMNRIRDS